MLVFAGKTKPGPRRPSLKVTSLGSLDRGVDEAFTNADSVEKLSRRQAGVEDLLRTPQMGSSYIYLNLRKLLRLQAGDFWRLSTPASPGCA